MSYLVSLPKQCIKGKFLRRVKRFSVEFEYNGATHWAHTNNSGAMLGLLHSGCSALFSLASGVARKLPFTLERMRLPDRMGGSWVGVNTLLPNRMLAAAFAFGSLDFCKGYAQIKMEAKRGQSRLDARLDGPGLPPFWVECKNVTLVEDDCAAFPDAASERAQKHLRELMDIVANGERAAMFYLVQRPDAKCFAPADYIDPAYARLFEEARLAGVEIYAYVAELHSDGTDLGRRLALKQH